MTDIDTAIRIAVLPWRKEPIYIHPSERAIWDAAFAAGAASVLREPVAWQLLVAGGKWSAWIRLDPPDDELDLWRPLYAAPAVAQG